MFPARDDFVAVLGILVGSALGAAAQVGTVLEERKISNLEGGFQAQLQHDDYFGISSAEPTSSRSRVGGGISASM